MLSKGLAKNIGVVLFAIAMCAEFTTFTQEFIAVDPVCPSNGRRQWSSEPASRQFELSRPFIWHCDFRERKTMLRSFTMNCSLGPEVSFPTLAKFQQITEHGVTRRFAALISVRELFSVCDD